MKHQENHADPARHPFFVYGTLLPGQPNFSLWSESIRASFAATFSGGRLHDMGHYPMLVEAERGRVKGIVVDVRPADYRRLLRRLDQLERFDPERPEDSLYRRILRPVTRPEGTSIMVWVYIGRPELVVGRPPIPSGDWVAYARSRYPDLLDWWVGRDQA